MASHRYIPTGRLEFRAFTNDTGKYKDDLIDRIRGKEDEATEIAALIILEGLNPLDFYNRKGVPTVAHVDK